MIWGEIFIFAAKEQHLIGGVDNAAERIAKAITERQGDNEVIRQ
jgi:hypothetical protein